MSAKGELRRGNLVDAAASVLRDLGPDAVTHRAVAAAAGLPLASTTYYFGSRAELLVSAVERAVEEDLAAAQKAVAATKPGKRSGRAAATLVLKLTGSGSALERALLARRESAVRPALETWTTGITALVREALSRSERTVTPRIAALVVAAADGFVLAEVAEGSADLSGAAGRLATVLDAVAPA
jgi:DNA-binding transcriptional regulator YbjK